MPVPLVSVPPQLPEDDLFLRITRRARSLLRLMLSVGPMKLGVSISTAGVWIGVQTAGQSWLIALGRID